MTKTNTMSLGSFIDSIEAPVLTYGTNNILKTRLAMFGWDDCPEFNEWLSLVGTVTKSGTWKWDGNGSAKTMGREAVLFLRAASDPVYFAEEKDAAASDLGWEY